MEAAGVGNGGLVGNESRPRSQICVLQPLASIFQLPDLSLFFFFFFSPILGLERKGQRGAGGWWLVGVLHLGYFPVFVKRTFSFHILLHCSPPLALEQ